MPESEEYKMKEIKFKVGTYEFSVKARCTVLNDKYNTRDTLYMMNMLSVVLDELAEGYRGAYKQHPEKEYLGRMSEIRQKESDQIFDQLDAMGFYKEGDPEDDQNE